MRVLKHRVYKGTAFAPEPLKPTKGPASPPLRFPPFKCSGLRDIPPPYYDQFCFIAFLFFFSVIFWERRRDPLLQERERETERKRAMAGRSASEGTIPSSPIRKENSRLLSSPPRRSNGKERRNPSITPRKFRRFFTPRPRVSSHLNLTHISPARKALRDLAAPNLNNRYQTPASSSPLRPHAEEDDFQDENAIQNTRVKRRKVHHTPDSSPCRPQRLEIDHVHPSLDGPALLSPIQSIYSSNEVDESDESEGEEDLVEQHPVKRLAPVTCRGLAGHLLQRETGGMPRAGRSYMSYPVAG